MIYFNFCICSEGAFVYLAFYELHPLTRYSFLKIKAYEIAEDFMNRFIEKKGTVVCRELLGYDVSKVDDMEKIRELNLFRTKCPEMIICATEILDEMIIEMS